MANSPTVPDQEFIYIVTTSETLAEAHRVMMESYGMGKSYYREVKRRAKKLGIQAGVPVMEECMRAGNTKITDKEFIEVITKAKNFKEACAELVKKYNVSPAYYCQMTSRAKKLGVAPLATSKPQLKVPEADFIAIVTSSPNYRQAGLRLIAKYNLSSGYINNVRARADRLGIKPGIQHAHEVPDDFTIDKSSTLVGKDGKTKLQWLKISKKKQDEARMIKKFALGLMEKKFKVPQIDPPEVPGDKSLLTSYIEPEPHFGMYSWAKETREDYDCDIARNLLIQAANRLVAAAPNSKYALVVGLGDGIHADNQNNETSSGNKLDVDTRWGKVIRAYAGFYKWWIELLLTKHDVVFVKRVKGNHDDQSTTAINVMLEYMFEDNKRVFIDQDETIIKYHRFGNNLIGITHGDKSKGDNLPLLMAADEPQSWGITQNRYFYTGHIHHLSRKEYIGCVVESFRSLAAKDSWHAGQGYRAGREMQMIVLDRLYGEVERHTVNVNQLTNNGE